MKSISSWALSIFLPITSHQYSKDRNPHHNNVGMMMQFLFRFFCSALKRAFLIYTKNNCFYLILCSVLYSNNNNNLALAQGVGCCVSWSWCSQTTPHVIHSQARTHLEPIWNLPSSVSKEEVEHPLCPIKLQVFFLISVGYHSKLHVSITSGQHYHFLPTKLHHILWCAY